MLTLQQIESQYPDQLRPFKRHLLREYFQYKILEIIFASKHAGKLSFLGGTALRIVYGNTRFSEDLDFDNFDLSADEFADLADVIKAQLELQGMTVEMSLAGKEAYRCKIRLPGVLFANELSGYEGEKIMIQIDSLAHGYTYLPDRKIVNRFDVFTEIFVTPPDILLSQKMWAVANRKRAKGRDFFDIVFLLPFTSPNYGYLAAKMNISDAEALRARLQEAAAELDFAALAADVRPFLFNPQDTVKVEKFPEYLATTKL